MRPGRVAAVLALAVAGCGGGDEPRGERRDPFVAIEEEFDRDSRRPARAAPRWETLARLSGDGARSRALTVSDRAIQWRVRWRCRAGTFRVSVAEDAAQGTCPDRGTLDLIGTGEREVAVEATGRWSLSVEQEVDTPLREPPPAAVRDGAPVEARGRFYGVERRGRGTATVHRLPDGRLAVRLEGFETAANTDLFVWASRAARPRTTRQALARPHRTIAPLKATQGDQNYVVPRGIGLDDLRSIVIWCEPVRIVYAVAALEPLGDRGGSATNSP